MSIKICHATLSENNDLGWGGKAKAGNQDGQEVYISDWYNGRWDIVLRPPTPELGEKASEAARIFAETKLVGYDQSERNSLYKALKNNSWNLKKYVKSNVPTEVDCSSFIYACYALYMPEIRSDYNAPATFTMKNWFLKWGFEPLTDTKYLLQDKYLKPGDILLNSSSHVAIALEDKRTLEPVIRNIIEPIKVSQETKEEVKKEKKPAIREVTIKEPIVVKKEDIIGFATAKEEMNVRSENSINGEIYGVINKGEKIEVLEILSNGWYRIIYPKKKNKNCYVSNVDNLYFEYKSLPASLSPKTSTYQEKTASETAKHYDSAGAGMYRTKTALNIRDGAGIEKNLLTTIPIYYMVRYYGYFNYDSEGVKWYSVQFKYKSTIYTGYVSSEFIEQVNG